MASAENIARCAVRLRSRALKARQAGDDKLADHLHGEAFNREQNGFDVYGFDAFMAAIDKAEGK